MREFALTASTMCMLVGATISAGCLLSWIPAIVAVGLGHLKRFSTDVFIRLKENRDKRLSRADAKKDGKTSKQKPDKRQSQLKKHSKALINSGWQNLNKNYPDRHESAPAQIEAGCEDSRRLPEQGCSGSETAFPGRSEPCPDDSAENAQKPKQDAQVPDVCENTDVFTPKIAVLLSDEKSVEFEGTPSAEKDCNTSQNGNPLQNVQKTALLDSPEDSLKSVDVRHFAGPDDALEDSLETQTEDFEKQVQEIKQMAQRVQQAAVEHSGPLNNTLVELTQEVAAIREYASNQQDRVKKLQEGYDWNIIKTFCLRIIRCVDNLESRISRLSEQDVKASNLDEIRDELVFALESSGVERFEPEINSDYRGQEKIAEAVKEKEHCDDPNLTGKIAKVIRPGYQYFIDEENVKVVRTAQVKLFG
ncbi:Protein GrpE [subsurface metagenome]